MSQLITALLIPAALALCSTAGLAKEIKGTPKALIGTFGKDSGQCRAYREKQSDDIIIFGKDYYSYCGGKWCVEDIVSHRITPAGFILTTIAFGEYSSGEKRRVAVKKIGKNALSFTASGPKSAILIRCPEKD